MKKLMLTAAAAAMAAGAFAEDPLVYDYQAAVTHMYAKMIKVQNKVTKQQVDVYQKFKNSTTLKGYLIQDTEGVTSPYLGDGQFSNAPVYDHGRNRAFLVVYNSGAEADVRAPKILPAVLEAKWFDQKFTHDERGNTTVSDGIAEGTLFVGGQFINALYDNSHTNMAAWYANVQPVRPKLDNQVDWINGTYLFGYSGLVTNVYPQATALVPPYVTPEMYSDYLWSSMYLFGEYNGPQWSGRYIASETEINGVQPWFFRLPTRHTFARESAVYHDTWMNHAGIGTSKVIQSAPGKVCCGLSLTRQGGGLVLQSLAGGMKGGLYICTDNGYYQDTNIYEPFLGTLWEDQFYAKTIDNLPFAGYETYKWPTLDAADDIALLHDVWVDGDVEQNTTDVIFGTWSITLISDFDKTVGKVELTRVEKNRLRAATYDYTDNMLGSLPSETVEEWTPIAAAASGKELDTTNDSYDALMQTIKGAAVKLNKNVLFTAPFSGSKPDDGAEIFDVKVTDRFNIPMLTPYFARAYGLANYGR